jgi:preprotein translocase subunit SecF
LIAVAATGSILTASFAVSCIAGVLAATFSSTFLLPFVWGALKLGHDREKEVKNEE